MFLTQVLAIITISAFYAVCLILFFRKFKKEIAIPIVLTMPIIVFALGYSLRLGGNKPAIDLGYFLTDSSYIFIYSLFTSALVIGQIKFWEK